MGDIKLTVRSLASTRNTEFDSQAVTEKKEESNHGHITSGSDLSYHGHVEIQENTAEDVEVQPVKTEESSSDTTSNSSDSDSDSNSDKASGSYELDKEVKHSPPKDLRRSPFTSCVQEAQLSPDGTCIFTSHYDRSFSVYPVANDLLADQDPQPLKPYARALSPNPIWAFTANPNYNIQDPSSTTVLLSRRDCYITLHNALWDLTQQSLDPSPPSPINISQPIASYKLINPLTEAVTAPSSLVFTPDTTHFFAGTKNSIAIFDSSYTNAPIQTIRTIPSARTKRKGGGRGFKGIISALSLSPPSMVSGRIMLAAGARTRYMGIYDSHTGQEITSFALLGTLNGKKLQNDALDSIMGSGVSSLKWSPCGTYLYVAERESDSLLIYDIRNFSLALGYCVGRKALTKQKLGFDVWNSTDNQSHEVWAGGTDGCVRMWRDPWKKQGPVLPDGAMNVNDGDAPVVGAMVHPSGCAAVAACGKKAFCGDDDDDDSGSSKKGRLWGGALRPQYREWGSVEILGLS